jgi:diaminopimelate decarboxylase
VDRVDRIRYADGALRCEDVPMGEIADRFGTPVYVYSRGTFADHLEGLVKAFRRLNPVVCFAVKACGNVHVLRMLAELGAGADVVSGGELYRARTAGVPAQRIVFAGVGKSEAELREAVDGGIRSINVESEAELDALAGLAASRGRTVRAAVRVNPDVGGLNTPAKTTTGIRGSKFGVDIERVFGMFDRAASAPSLALDGLHVHLGSPVYGPAPYVAALEKLVPLADELTRAGRPVRSINIGGGFAAAYESEGALPWQAYADEIVPLLAPFAAAGGEVVLEPGRSVAANAGVLLTRVRWLKQAGDRTVAVLDAGMSQLMRVAMYDSFHFVWPVAPGHAFVPPSRTMRLDLPGLVPYDLAGPICESSDYLARNRHLPPLRPDDVLAIFGSGAYGMTMASQYNAIPRAAEVLVDGGTARLVRRRETYADLVAAELDV